MPKLSTKVIQSLFLVLILSAQAPPSIDGPTIKAEQKTDGAIQNQQAPKPEAQRRTPARLKTPGLAGSDPASNDGEQGGEQGTEFWPSFMGYRVKVTDSLQVLLTAVLAIVTAGLYVSTRRLWLDSREQTRIQSETREIALAALDRPYILIFSASHNRDEWRDGARHLAFHFRIRNYGDGLGIIRSIEADVFLSSGSDTPQTDDKFPAKPFSHGSRMAGRLDPVPVIVNPNAKLGLFGSKVGTMTLERGAIGPPLVQWANMTYVAPPTPLHRKGPNYRREAANSDFVENYPDFEEVRQRCGSMPVWLVGKITYEGVLGREYHTSFCFRGENDGSAVEAGLFNAVVLPLLSPPCNT